MNKILLLLAVILLLPFQAEATPASLSIENFSIKAGETKEMVIDMNNPDDQITLVQFDMRLPNGLSIAIEDGNFAIDIAGRTTWKNHSLNANALDGVTRFLLASNNNTVISGTEGAIISVKLVADDDFSGGDILLENILLVTPLQKETKPDMYVYTISNDIVVGDVNGDGVVTTADIVVVANYLLGNSSGNFDWIAADVDGNGSVDAADVVALVNIIMITNTPVTPEVKKTSFDLGDYYADCTTYVNGVEWNEIEYNVCNKLVGMSKERFNATYEFDQYKSYTEGNTPDDQTIISYAEQYEQDAMDESKFTKLVASTRIGEVIEERNASGQEKEDGTTHVLKWKLSSKDFSILYNALNREGKLDRTGSNVTNAREISTWVRYKRKGTADGEPAIYIKFTIPAGKLHFAKGTLDGTKTLTYWYNLNSNMNAAYTKDAREVHINVPVPVPNAMLSVSTLSALTCPWGEPLQITNDNLLERNEFLKDLHDYFRNGKLEATVTDKTHFRTLAKANITPEFKFTQPSMSLGNATFNANPDGTWQIIGSSGKKYTLKLFNYDSEIRISPYRASDILCSLNDDNDGVQSVIKFHEGEAQDDILNAYGHNKLGERETFTAYITIDTPDVCAPIEFDDMWFNVRFIRPLDLQHPAQGLLSDNSNGWQYVDLANYIKVHDWREYVGNPNNLTGGYDSNYQFDFAYYQIEFDTDEALFMTDAHLSTAERDSEFTNGKMIDVNTDITYKRKLWKTSEVNGLLVQKTDKEGGDQVPNNTKTTWIRYKNNSGVTSGFHVYVPVQMTYVFGQGTSLTQTKYITIGITSTH